MTEKDVKEVTEVAKQKLKESGNIYFDHILAYISYLEAQIEKMKCCGNCKHENDSNTDYYCEDCKRFAGETNIEKWELAE